ncbi:MAG TPA: U32 family peptidase [Tepidisphaeraceae bacterium]
MVPTSAPELLAPAGDMEAMRAAVANGADAVYFGLDQFNARHRAENFTLETLPGVMDYLHRHNVRGFVTFNTLIFSNELPAAVDYVKAIAAAGVDAVIVQDLGVARMIKRIAPTLPVHGSTQMTLTEPRGIAFVRRLGVSRVVLARELSVDDIEKVAAKTDTELEVFVHGALCVAYSGQCLTSESFGGRSANRGQCAQACRLPYELIVDGQPRDLGDVRYLVSPKDLAAYELVDRMTKLGVASFKIEGRLKGGPYVAATASTYRAAIDAAVAARPFVITPQQQGDLEQVFSRGLGTGFLGGVNHQTLVPGRFPKSRGRRVGTVVRMVPRGFVIEVSGNADLKPGDGIVFDEGRPESNEAGGRVYAVKPLPTTRRLADSPHQIQIELGRNDARPDGVRPGAIVWKTDDPEVTKRLQQSYAKDRVVHRVPIDMHVVACTADPLRLTLTDGTHTVTVDSAEPLKPADQYPATERLLKDQLSMLATTPFSLGGFACEISGGPITPKGMLADVRRRGVEAMIERRKRAHAVLPLPLREGVGGGVLPYAAESAAAVGRALPAAIATEMMSDTAGDMAGSARPTALPLPSSISPITANTPHPNPLPQGEREPEAVRSVAPVLHVMARTLDQVSAVLALDAPPATVYCDFEDVRRYKQAVDLCRAANVPIALATMRIVKPGEDGWLKQLLDCGADAVLVRNLAAIEYFTEFAPGLPLYGDYALNVANEWTADVFREAGLQRLVPSYDLNWRQMAAMMGRSDPALFECVIHQHMPMFHMEHCVFSHTLSDGTDYRTCGRPCETHAVDLKDRTGQSHPLIPDAGCRNTLYNAAAQSAAGFVPRMLELGVRHFRVELLRQKPDEVGPLIRQYRDVLAGRLDPKQSLRSLRVVSQLGVTAGTLDRE